MSELEELQNTLFTIYNKNISYLKNNYPNLFKRIVDFEKLNIETQYIDFQNGFFELVEIANEKNIYNCNSYNDASYRASNIEKSNAIFSMLVEQIDTKNYNKKNEISAHKIVSEIIDLKEEKSSIEKFIFFGTLLGIHINDIHKKINQKAYLIVEPSLERFRLSLFFTDYEEISKKSKLFFSIEENEIERKSSLLNFLEYDFSLNHQIKFELASEKEFFLVQEFKNTITTLNPFITAFSEDIISLQRGLNNIEKSKGLLKISNLEIFDEKPILILGAGPSLEKYQDFIKNNHDKFIILAASATLKRLEYLDIVPDIIINIDKKENEILEQFNVNEKYFKNSICFLGPKTNPKIVNITSSHTFIVQENYEIFRNINTISCVSVGDFAYKLSLELGAKNIYLLGIDAAFSEDKTHDSLHLSSNNLSENSYEKTLIDVTGNFEKKVKTNLLYNEIINSFYEVSLDKGINSYNLSNGAKLYSTKALNTNDINTKTKILKDEFKEKALELLEKNCTNRISEFDKKKFQKELKILKKVSHNIEDKKILELLKKYPNSKSLNILYKYLKLINPYISSKQTEKIKKDYLNEIKNTLILIFKD